MKLLFFSCCISHTVLLVFKKKVYILALSFNYKLFGFMPIDFGMHKMRADCMSMGNVVEDGRNYLLVLFFDSYVSHHN